MCSYTCINGYKPTANNSSMKCHDGAWSIQEPCREIPECPSAIPNGEIIGSCTFLDGAECAYTCNRFYIATKPSSRITCVEGRWSEQTPCSFSTAKCPEMVDKVLFGSACNHNNGETCTYRCDHGYTPTAHDDTMTCDDGSWDVERPCDEIVPDCPYIEQVEFATTCLYQNGETCTFLCAVGYHTLTSSNTLICNGGNWSTQTPCVKDCPTQDERVLFLAGCTFHSGEKCSYSCTSGYEPTSSDSIIECNEGVWNIEKPCAQDCPAVVGAVIFDNACSYHSGEMCSYTCINGYKPTATNSSMKCHDGAWSIQEPCREIPECPSAIPNGEIIGSCTFHDGAECAYTCNRFYIATKPSSRITCVEGRWSEQTPCSFSTSKCPETVDKVLFGRACNHNNGETCTYRCDHGYTPTAPDDTITCDNGSWDVESPCDKIVPDCPYIEQVEFATTCLYQNRETCTFSCAVGYLSLTSSNTLICNGGNWSTQTPCVKDCSTQDERVLFLAGCTFHSGEKCSYSCISGYEPTSSDNTIECNEGVWNIEKPCAQDCQAVVGAVILDNACLYHSDETCSYTCINGYKPTATNSSMKCHDGAWSIQEPCREIPKCLSAIPYGEIIGSCTFLDGAECAYTCNRFYIATKPSSRITCVEGRWSEQTPCSFSTAKCPEMVDKVLFGSACNHNNGETCTYRCDHGYTPTAHDDTMKCDDGSWDVERPCDEIDPVCSSAVDNVLFDAACLFQNDETCTFRCSNGANPTTSDSSMKCRGGYWSIQTPCAFITTTTTTITSRHTSSKSSSPTPSQGVPPGITDAVSIVPIAASAGAAGFILIIIVIVLLLVIYVRSRKPAEGAEHHEFESPVYQGFVYQDSPYYNTLEAVSRRPDTTYDLIDLNIDDKLEYKGAICNRVGNDYRKMRPVMTLSREYETLHWETSDYLEPTASIIGSVNFI